MSQNGTEGSSLGESLSALTEMMKEKADRISNIRAALLADKAALQTRLEEIEKGLAQLDDLTEGPKRTRTRKTGGTHRPHEPRGKTLGLVLEVLREAGRPLKATELIEGVKAKDETAEVPKIHSVLFRMTKEGKIVATGEKRNKEYSAPESSVEVATSELEAPAT